MKALSFPTFGEGIVIRSVFYHAVFRNDWRVCEAKLVHDDRWNHPTFCTQVDGIWMCHACYEEKERNPKAGGVYLVGSEKAGYFYIDDEELSSKAARRASALPFRTDMSYRIATDDQVACRRALEKTLRHRQVRNNWYALSGEDLAQVKLIKRFANSKFVDADQEPLSLNLE